MYVLMIIARVNEVSVFSILYLIVCIRLLTSIKQEGQNQAIQYLNAWKMLLTLTTKSFLKRKILISLYFHTIMMKDEYVLCHEISRIM